MLYYTQTGLENGAAFTQSRIVCAGPVGPGTLPSGVQTARKGLPTWYLTEQAALAKIQPLQSLRSLNAAAGSSRPEAKVACFDIASGTSVYSDLNTSA